MILKPLRPNGVILSGLSLVLFLAGCDLMQEPKVPTWTNRLEFPLIKTSVNLETLKDQEGIQEQLYVTGDSTYTIFAYTDTMEMDSQAVGEQLEFGDITQSFGQSVDDVTVTGSNIHQSSGFDAVGVDPIVKQIKSEVGTIELSDIDPSNTDPFQLNEIIPSVNDIPNGSTAEIPEADLEPVVKPFSFTAFSEAVFAGGTLDITIHNDMVIALGSPIVIQLQKVDGSDTTNISGGTVTWNSVISTGSAATESLDLTGMTLPGSILIQVTGHSVGSEGASIPINDAAKTSSFYIEISGSNLQVSSATAKVPGQTISEDGTITMADSENKVESAIIKVGSLSLAVENQMAVASQLTINIPSLQDPTETAFTTVVDILANGTVEDVTDISDYFLVMDVNQQEVQYNYTVITEDTGDDLVTITDTDSIKVTISLFGENSGDQLFFKRITGIIESQIIEQGGEIAIESDSKLLVADISAGSITISIDNQVNQPGYLGLPTIELTINELLDVNSNPLSGALTLEPNPTANVLEFDLSEYALTFPDTLDQTLTYTTVVTTPSGELGRYGLEDSIFVDIQVSDMEFTSVTGFFTQDALVDSSEIALEEDTKLLEANFASGNFELTVTNRIGVVADVAFQIDEFINKNTNQPLFMDFTLNETDVPLLVTRDLSDFRLVFSDAQADQDQAIHYISRVSIPSDEQMTLTFGDSIIIDVNIDNLALQSVTGIVAPDTLTLPADTVTFEMPEMVEDLMFEHVYIDIDFNSSFDIPLELTLNLSGSDEFGTEVRIDTTHSMHIHGDELRIDAAPLLNIKPEFIISSGQAVIGDGISTSTIAQGQSMAPTMYINVPLSLIIEDPPFLEMDASSMDSPLPEDIPVTLEEFTIFADIVNMFEFGATVVVLASPDSLAFDSAAIAMGTAPAADTLVSIELLPNENTAAGLLDHEITEIGVSSDKMYLLEEKMYMKPEVQLLGNDELHPVTGEPMPSRFFTTDSLSVRTWGGVSYTIEGDELLNGEDKHHD